MVAGTGVCTYIYYRTLRCGSTREWSRGSESGRACARLSASCSVAAALGSFDVPFVSAHGGRESFCLSLCRVGNRVYSYTIVCKKQRERKYRVRRVLYLLDVNCVCCCWLRVREPRTDRGTTLGTERSSQAQAPASRGAAPRGPSGANTPRRFLLALVIAYESTLGRASRT